MHAVMTKSMCAILSYGTMFACHWTATLLTGKPSVLAKWKDYFDRPMNEQRYDGNVNNITV